MLRETVLVFATFAVFTSATTVNQCGTEIPFKDSTQIIVSNCDKPTCLMKQGTEANIQIKLVPNRTINSLTNEVSALLFNVFVPFIGVDGTDACENIYNTDGSKAGCPLREGSEYVYKNSFKILPIYPRVSLVVHYALREGNDKVICFEVPSKITK